MYKDLRLGGFECLMLGVTYKISKVARKSKFCVSFVYRLYLVNLSINTVRRLLKSGVYLGTFL